jgi:hypothetical protein
MTGGPQAVGERGAVLLVSLLVLLLIALVANAVARSNLLQVHMAGNAETKTTALQNSLALVDMVMADESSTPVTGGLGYKVCVTGASDPGCDQLTLSIDKSLTPASGRVELSVSRMAPLAVPMPVMAEHSASSSQAYRAARFEVRAGYDGVTHKQGRAVVVQGVLVRITAATN